MKKAIAMILTLCLLLAGCHRTAADDATADTVTVTDDLGRSVTLTRPDRVATLLGSFAQVWQLSGGQVCAAPSDAWQDLALELPADCVNLGSTKHLSLELLLSAQPELVLASANSSQHLQWQSALEEMGIPVLYFSVEDFSDYLRMLSICTTLTEQPALYEANGLAVQAQIDAVLQRSRQRLAEQPAPRVLCLTASATSVRAQNSHGNVLCGMLNSLGCINIAEIHGSLLENLSMEYILLEDPDYIFFVQRGDDAAGTRAYVERFIQENPAWQQLTAVKFGRVYFMDKLLFNLKPNHRWGEAYEILEDLLENG